MEQKKRLRKFKREKEAFRPQIQPRDLEIIRSLADYRFLNSVQIMALHPGGERNIQRRLQKLFHAGYIDRPPRQISYHKPMGYMVYGLGNKGADLLTEHFPDFERKKIDWTTKNRETRERYIYHALMVSNFRTVLTLALRNHQEARLSRWQQGTTLKDQIELGGRKVALVPDAFFTLQDSSGKANFFLEADRSTMTRGRMLQKLRAYWRWYRQGGHEKKLGIKGFRVLTLCKSDLRKENLRQIAKEADDKKTGSLMFWFCQEGDIDLLNPQSILKPIWQTPGDDGSHFLLEKD